VNLGLKWPIQFICNFESFMINTTINDHILLHYQSSVFISHLIAHSPKFEIFYKVATQSKIIIIMVMIKLLGSGPASIMLKNLPGYYAFRNFPKLFPIMFKYQPIMLKIMLPYFSYCIIYHKNTR